VYYPPYHSKYNLIERCWGILENHWNGTFGTDRELSTIFDRESGSARVEPIVSRELVAYRHAAQHAVMGAE
jgi:transposase